MSSDQVPKEAKIASLLLNSSGILECEPKVVQQLMEFMFKYSTEVLQLSSIYSDHAQKTQIDATDVRLAIKSLSRKSQNPALEREFLQELALRKNSLPLPIISDSKAKILLPPEQHCLLSASYKITATLTILAPLTKLLNKFACWLICALVSKLFEQSIMFSKKFARPEYLSKPSKASVLFGTVFGSVMWFWIMFRAKQDGPYLLGLKSHFDNEEKH